MMMAKSMMLVGRLAGRSVVWLDLMLTHLYLYIGILHDSSLPLYWDSPPEAAKLFGFSYQDGDDVHKGVQDIITSLTRAQQSHDGYKHFVANIDQAEALITTKYHAEYAGEGIEYSWGAAKAMYRRYPLASKKGKEKFVDLVLKCTS
jgi:hypothetical protein